MDRELAILGWSQAHLAFRLGVTPTAVSRWRSRGMPLSVKIWLVDVVWQVERAREVLARYERPKGRARGIAVKRESVYQLSAAQAATQVVGGDYVRRLERAEESDLDQSEDWGRG